MFHTARRPLSLLLALILLCIARPGRAEGEDAVYFLGNFAFGMPAEAVRAMDQSGAALIEADAERELQRITFLSDHFAVSLWFQGLDDTAPLAEMNFVFFMDPDTVLLRDGRLEIGTTKKTVNAVYGYVESLCKKTFGKGKNAPDGALPVPSLLFSDEESAVSLTRLRVYTLPDAGKTDVIVHAVAAGNGGANYVILRQADP